MRVLVCGARDYTDRARMYYVLDKLHKLHTFTLLIHGGAKGADTLAGEWARTHNVPVKVFHADWKKFGRAAGPIRNKQMLVKGQPDLVVAFPKTILAKSRGTKNMVMQAMKALINVIVEEIHGETTPT